jgi:hypothetical protein
MHQAKIFNLQYVNQELTKNGMVVPGCARGTNRSAWLLPMIVADKAQFKEFAFQSGVLCFRGATQVKLVPEPSEKFKIENPQYLGVPKSKWMLDHIVYMPVNSFISAKDIRVLANRMTDVSVRYQMYIKQVENQPKVDKIAQHFEDDVFIAEL